MIRRHSILFSVLFCLALTPLPMSASDIDAALAAYDRGEIGTAFGEASKSVKDNPQNATAWYILGNCYLKQNALREAKDAFARCLALKPQGKIAAYAAEALAALQSPSQVNPPFPHYGQSQSTDYNTSLQATSVESHSREAQLTAELQKRIQEKELQKQAKINDIQEQSRQAINGVPEYFYDSYGRRHRNPDYSRLVADINADTDRRIAEIVRIYDKDEGAFRADTQQRLNALGDFADKTMQWSRTSQGNVQQTPHGTNLFVHNYVNFGLDEEEPPPVVPLKAKALPYNPKLVTQSQTDKAKSPAAQITNYGH